MYSSKAAVTASFLVLCFPERCASSISLSSRARLVAMCRYLHITLCKSTGQVRATTLSDIGLPAKLANRTAIHFCILRVFLIHVWRSAALEVPRRVIVSAFLGGQNEPRKHDCD